MHSAELNLHSVLGRAFGLLDAFADGPPGSGTDREFSLTPEHTLTELSQRTGVPKGSLHRLLGQLVALDVVERTGNRYRLSLHMIELAGLSPWLSQLRETVLPFMIDLHEATHQTIHLGVLRDADVVYVERIRSHLSINCPTRIGGRMPAYCTGLGKTLLAFAGKQATGKVLATGLRRRTPYTIVAPGLLMRDLKRAADEGTAYDREEAVLGLVCVAAPVLVGNRPVAAISVSGRASEIQRPRLSHLVKDAASNAGQALEPRMSVR
jgi:IclR family transcriptional regulator, acetate operon repressor